MNPRGNVSGDPVNDATDKSIRTRSRFPSLSYHLYNTERFGEYNTPFVMDCVEGDKVPIRSGGHVSSYTLKAPLMQSISKKKDFYMVPMEAILPINWQKWYTNPTVGDDVPDACGTGVEHFWQLTYNLWSALKAQVNTNFANTSIYTSVLLTSVLRTAIIGEYFYSHGSLIKSLGCSGDRFCKFRFNNRTYSFDYWFDSLIGQILESYQTITFMYEGVAYRVINDESSFGYMRSSGPVVSFRTFLQMMRDDLTVYVSAVNSLALSAIVSRLSPFFDNSVWSDQSVSSDLQYDTRRLWAYQLTVAHFYSNDFIDYIYSAELFRSLIGYYCFTDQNGARSPFVFTCNGIQYEYDALSSYCTWEMFLDFTNSPGMINLSSESSDSASWQRRHLAYFSSLFSYRRSLRYVDYFTGSRSRPLAVGDVNVYVNSNFVNVIDVSRNVQRQRFFNAVNRFGRKFEDYIEGLSGVRPSVDYHNPLYLAHTSDTVYGVETENTGAAQQSNPNSITSRFQTNGSKYQFEFSVDRPCVVIGISYYDMPRAYTLATERQLFYLNRFDMFNPYMQFIGDQAVGFAELGSYYTYGSNGTFGYQLRHMEYKQRYDQAAGGFIESLPGFLFTDQAFGSIGSQYISPNFIRSLNSELDGFYVALTGYSLGHYFHFIVDNDNSCDASRPMAYAPSIL